MKNDFERIRSNVELMAQKGASADQIDSYLFQEGLTRDKFKARMEGVRDAGLFDTAARYSAGSGVANLLDLPGRTVTAAANLATMAGGIAGNKLLGTKLPETIPPDQLDIANPAFRKVGVINDDFAPTTNGGKIVDFGTQAITGGGVNPRALVSSLRRGAIKPVVRDLSAATASGVGAGVGNVLSDGVDFGNESLNTGIKIGSTILGGLIPGAAIAARGTAGDRAAAATQGVTPEQMALARELKRKANSLGTPITDYEAIQSVTGLSPKMQTQQRLAEQSDASAKTLTPIMQNRAKANSVMFNNAANSIAPVEQYPDVLAGQLQKAAQAALQKTKDFRTSAASPDYRAQRASDIEAMNLADQVAAKKNQWQDRIDSRNKASQISGKLAADANQQEQISKNFYPVPGQPKFPQRYTHQAERAEEYQQAANETKDISRKRVDEAIEAERQFYEAQDALAEKNLPYVQSKVGGFLRQLDDDIRIAGPTTEGKILKGFRDEIAPEGSPLFYPSQLESIYKANRNKLDLGLSPTDLQKTQAGVLGPYIKNLDSLIQDVSPAIKQGRQIYAQVSKDVVDPLDSSQVGKLARSDDFVTQAKTLLPDKPMDVTPSVVERTFGAIGEQDPDIGRRMLAQYLRGSFNEANQKNVGGDNVFGGSKFAANMAGNADQEANLIAAVRASGAETQPFQDAINIFRAQGYKPPVNSATVPNADEAARLGGLTGALTRPLQALPGAIDRWRNGMATSDLAKALAAQDASGPMRIEELARSNGVYDPMKQQMLINMLMANPESQ